MSTRNDRNVQSERPNVGLFVIVSLFLSTINSTVWTDEGGKKATLCAIRNLSNLKIHKRPQNF